MIGYCFSMGSTTRRLPEFLPCKPVRRSHCPRPRSARRFLRDPARTMHSIIAPIKNACRETKMNHSHTQNKMTCLHGKKTARNKMAGWTEAMGENMGRFRWYLLWGRLGRFRPANSSPMGAFDAPFWVLLFKNDYQNNDGFRGVCVLRCTRGNVWNTLQSAVMIAWFNTNITLV